MMKKELYPANWKQISLSIRERAGNRCEWCGVPNGVIGYREESGNFITLYQDKSEVGQRADTLTEDGIKLIRIVLTVAHLDHTPANCDPANLVALCQKCHLAYDAKFHAQNAANTRRKKRIERGQLELL